MHEKQLFKNKCLKKKENKSCEFHFSNRKTTSVTSAKKVVTLPKDPGDSSEAGVEHEVY